MKKLASLLLIILLLFSFGACTIDDDEPIHVPPSNWYNAAICLSGYAGDQGYWDFALNEKDTSSMPVYKIETAEELADFKTNLQSYFSFSARRQNAASFNEVTANCSDTFFSEKALLIVYIVASSGTYRYRIPTVEVRDDGVLTVTVEQYNDEGDGNCDMSGWLAVIEVPKEKLNSVTSYNALRTDN